MGKNSARVRSWSAVIYPDSAPDNWREILDDYHIEWVESPLHDRDISATNEPKKAHWHILLMFGGLKSFEQVVEFLQPLNCPIPQRCHNAKSLVRYFAHLDHPDKAQYNICDIIAHGGVEIVDLLRPSSSERYTLISDMVKYVQDNDITEFFQLVDYAREDHYDDWFPLLCDSAAYVLDKYIKSNRERYLADARKRALERQKLDRALEEGLL